MTKTIQIRVDKSLQKALEQVQKEVAIEIKNKHNLNSVTIHGTLASQIAAAKIMGKKSLNFKIKKQKNNRGILELIY